MSEIIALLFILLFFYILLFYWLSIGFFKTDFFYTKANFKDTSVTIIICARNEENKIKNCLNSIINQDYLLEKIELLFINDASIDRTGELAESILQNSNINFRIISNLEQKGKKQSITEAMLFANNELIVMRDADTFTLSKKWLQTISDFYQSFNSDFIIGPITIANNYSMLWAIQALENNILSLVSCGSVFYNKAFLCNGANLIFKKSIFEKTNGYESHINFNSGDDILFMEDVKKIHNIKIDYLKSEEAIVYTYPCFSIKELLKQKIRWASKYKINQNKLNLYLSILILTINLGWIMCFFIVFFKEEYKLFALLFIFLKLIIDFLLLFLSLSFIKTNKLIWFSLPVGFIYSFYTLMVGIGTLFIKPKWKN